MTYNSVVRLNVLILYDKNSTFTNTVREYLSSFSIYSQHHIFYAHATHNAQLKIDLDLFDVVVIHYSVRLSLDWHLSPDFAQIISKFNGLKVLYIQDEYENTETARKWITDLGISAVFSCVPQNYIDIVYPSSRFTNIEFKNIITGFVPIYMERKTTFKPISERNFYIGYRGRELPYWYGNLGREKLIIGQKMRDICREKNIKCDIEWEEDKRIYGEKWYDFIANCRAFLGTESGSNVFDDYGDIRKNIQLAIKYNPSISYEEIHKKYLDEHEDKIIMNQISPKIFEAISLKTALILFEGNYSGIIQPDIHYIPLKKDFSNVEDVLQKLNDINFLENLTERAYQDIIKSGKYSYQKFIKEFDIFILQRTIKTTDFSPFDIHESQNKQATIKEVKDALREISELLRLIIKDTIKNILKTKLPKLWNLLQNLKLFIHHTKNHV